MSRFKCLPKRPYKTIDFPRLIRHRVTPSIKRPMNITRTTLPKNSVLNTSGKKYDYVDSFQGILNGDKNEFTSVEIAKAFFSSGPKWVGKLFTVRNKIVSLFGLKTSNNTGSRESQIETFKCEPGERIGIFKVFFRNVDEVILGEDDKHLNFRVSLLLDARTGQPDKKYLIISTTVQFNNLFGRLYFLPVQPFHKLIVPSMLKGIIKKLGNR